MWKAVVEEMLPSGDLDLEAPCTGDEGCKARKSLLAATPNSNQHGTPPWL